MAYGLNPAGLAREIRDAAPGANGRDDADDVELMDLEEDLDDDADGDDGGNIQTAVPQHDPVDYELLISVAHGLGRWMQDTQTGQKVYVKDQDCLGCLKDLQRFLRRDDLDIRPVFKRLGEWRIAAHDVVPLLVTYPHDKEITLQAVKVLTYLTMPVDPSTAQPKVQEGYVRDVKEAMLQQDALVAVLGLVAEPLAAHPRMSPEQQGAVQLVMVLLRNLLAVPDEQPSPTLAAGSSRTRLQASLLSLLFSESIMELLLLVAQHGNQGPLRKEMPTLLEILCDTYRDITPHQLLAAKPPPPPRAQQRKQQPAAPPVSVPGTAAAPPQVTTTAGGGLGQTPAAATAPRPSPAAFHPTGVAGRGATSAGRPPGPLGGAAIGSRPCPRALDSAVAAQLRRQQLANAAKLRNQPGAAAVMASRPGTSGGRFIIAHADDPGQRRTFLAMPAGGGATAAATVKQHIVEAPPKMAGPRAHGSSSDPNCATRRDAALVWKLRCFADDLLESGYNQVMEVIRREVSAGVGVGRLERPDLLRFMRLAAFFTQYCRLQQEARATAQKQNPTVAAATTAAQPAAATDVAAAAAAAAGGSPSPSPSSPFSGISGTMGWDTFHLVCKLWVEQADMSKKLKDWELQAVSMRLLCEMLAVLVVAHRHGTREDRQAADRLQRRLLHDDMQESGLLPVLSRLMTSFVPSYQPRSYACDLVMSLHYVLRMYDRLTSLEPGGFLVRAKKRRGGRNGGRKKQQQQQQEEEEENKGEGGEDGGEDQDDKEDEDGGVSQEGGNVDKVGRRSGGSGKAPMDELAEGSEEEEDEEDGGEGHRGRGVVERPLDLASKVRGKLAQPAVIYFTVQLLACYKALPAEVPRAIASLLYRIAAKEHLDMEPLLYQISVLRVFYVLLSDPELRTPGKLPAYREVLLLATRVVRNLFRKLVPERHPREDGGGKDTGKGTAGGEAEGGPAAGGGKVEQQENKRHQRRRELVDEIHDKAPRMLLVDMLFWKDHTAAAAINQDYWLWMALEDREREEAEKHATGWQEGGREAAVSDVNRRRRGRRDAWGDDDRDGDEDIGAGGRNGSPNAHRAADNNSGGEEEPRTAGRLRRPGGLWSGEAGGGDDGELADGDDGGGAPVGAGRKPTSAMRRWTALGFGEEDDEQEEGALPARGPLIGGLRSQGGIRGAVLLSDEEEEDATRGGAGGGAKGHTGAAAEAAGGAAARKPLTLQEREEMLRKRFMKTVRVGNGRNKSSGRMGGEDGAEGGGGGGGRGLRLSSAQQALLLQVFERHNSSRHNADLILEIMKRGGATGGVDGKPAAGEAANAAGIEMSQGQLMRQLKKMALRFKQLTENQMTRLTALHNRYREDSDCPLMIAAQLPGGWTSKDIKRLLVKHGFTKVHRRGRRGSGSESGSDSASGSENDSDSVALDEEELTVLWEEHGGQPDAAEKIAATLVTPAPATAVAAKLRKMGLLKRVRKDAAARNKGRGGKQRGGAEGGPADVAALRRLYEEHRSRPDYLNVISALLPGGKTVKQVQRLLRSHGLLDDDAARRKKARDAAERTRLVAVYQQTRGESDQLAAIARLMPDLAGGAKQVAKLLRKHGLTEAPRRQRRRRSSDGEEEGIGAAREVEGGAVQKGSGRAATGRGAQGDDMNPSGSRAKVHEPDRERILQALAGIQDEHNSDGRWMDPRGAAAWVSKQLSAAEALWEMAGGPSSDYCLVMTGEEDEDFFMTEYSQDLLEACGISNAADDYYKVPATSTPAWRQRVRQALDEALAGLGTERAKELAVQLRQRREEEEEAERQDREARDAAAAEAAVEAALFAKTTGRKPSNGDGTEKTGRGHARGGGGRGRGGRSTAVADEDEAGGAGRGRAQQRRRGQGRRSGGKAASEVSESSESRGSSNESGSETGSETGSDGGGSRSGSDSEGHRGEALVMPNFGNLGSSSSDDDEVDVVDGGDGEVQLNGRQRPPGVSKPRKGVAAGHASARAMEAERTKADAGQRHRLPEALDDSSNSDGEAGEAAGRKRAASAATNGLPVGKAARPKAGNAAAATGSEDSDDGGKDGPGADADARRRALAEIARRRHEQARRLQERIGGTLVPAAAPSMEELQGGSNNDDNEEDHENGNQPAVFAGAGVGREGHSAGSRRRRSGDPVQRQAASAAAVNDPDDTQADEEESFDGAKGTGVSGVKRRRLLRKGATAGLGSGKENVGLMGPVLTAAGGGKDAGAPAGNELDEEMVELEDGLEDF